MLEILRRRDSPDREKFNSLLVLKNSILDKRSEECVPAEEIKAPKIDGDLDAFYKRTEEILERLSELDKKVESLRKDRYTFLPDAEGGARSARIKSMVKSLLNEHKRLSSAQLSKMLNLSRNRCNEYLKEMEREGLTRGFIYNKKKFYELKQ